MTRYTLTNEGKARFKRMKIKVNTAMAKMEGYEVLDYLYEHGAATVEEIENYTGLSGGQVSENIWAFIHRGYVEKLAEQ